MLRITSANICDSKLINKDMFSRCKQCSRVPEKSVCASKNIPRLKQFSRTPRCIAFFANNVPEFQTIHLRVKQRPRLHGTGQDLSAQVFVRIGPAFTRYLPTRTKICPDSRTKTCPVTQRTNCELVRTNICAAPCKHICPCVYLHGSITRPHNSCN